MISGRQLKQVLSYSFASGPAVLAPTGNFIVTPNEYTVTSLPGSVVLSGTLIPNGAVNIVWTITTGSSALLLSGTGNTVNYTLPSVPSTVSSNVYNWNITYQDGLSNTYSLILSTLLLVTSNGLVGQLNGASEVITLPIPGPVESSLVNTTKTTMINLFPINAVNVGRIVVVIPNSFGAVTDIEDNTNSTVLNQFDVIQDIPNNRTIYVGINAVTPAIYYYKIVF